MKITYHIKEEREKQNMSVRDLSKKCGVSKTLINDVEKRNICVHNLCLIAEALIVEPNKLFTSVRKNGH